MKKTIAILMLFLSAWTYAQNDEIETSTMDSTTTSYEYDDFFIFIDDDALTSTKLSFWRLESEMFKNRPSIGRANLELGSLALLSTINNVNWSGTDLTVSNGGIGVSSLTAYAPVFGGTSGTGAVQSGTVGTLGQALISNGPGSLPTFQDFVGGLENLEDDGTSIQNSISGTGSFNWDNISINGNIISNPTTGITSLDLSNDVTLNGNSISFSSAFGISCDAFTDLNLNSTGGSVVIENGGIILAISNPPSSASDTGMIGQVEWDTNYIYICVAINTWKRVAIATW